MSDEWPSKAEQEGLHNYGGGFLSPGGKGTTAYSPPTHTPPPLELEAITSEPSRTVAPAENVPGLTVAECAAAYGLSETTVRRLIKGSKGKPPKVNASKVTGPKGVEYRISPASMEVLGYQPKATQSGALLTASRANLEAETLAAKVRELEASLVVANLLREAAEKESALMSQSLNDLREVISKLPKALPPVERSPRWWKRKV